MYKARKKTSSKLGAAVSRMLSVICRLRVARDRPETPFKDMMNEDERREIEIPVRDQLCLPLARMAVLTGHPQLSHPLGLREAVRDRASGA